MSSFSFGIIGGDYRYKILYDLFSADGYSVKAYKNDYITDSAKNIDDLIRGIDILIAPIPCSKDNQTIFLKDESQITLDSIMQSMYENDVKIFAGGVVKKEIKIKALDYNIRTFDFFEQESVAVLNAIATAEGAVQTAMEHSDKTIFGSSALVLGYGRCGKILSNMLKGIGANVSTTYRNDKDAAYIKAYGLNGFNLNALKCHISNFDFVFNTIPAEILNKEILRLINRHTIIIDIAQAPGGVDYGFARDLNIKALYCPGLPGRVAPYTAAEILKSALLDICLSHIA